MTIQLWQPSNPPSHSSDFRLAIMADFTKTSPHAPALPQKPPADDESNYYTAYATGLGWLPSPE